jgi:co-chaperonin GroES (HSP10)
MEMKPIGDLILIKEREKTDKTKSGIIIMDGIDGDFVYADVIKTGDGLFTQTGDRIPMTTKPGSVVLINKNNLGSQKQVRLDEVDYILVREAEVSMVSC